MVLQPLLKVWSANLLTWHQFFLKEVLEREKKPYRVLIKAKLPNALICCSRLFWATLNRGDPFTSFKNIEKLSEIGNQIKTKIIAQFHSVIFCWHGNDHSMLSKSTDNSRLQRLTSAVSKLIELEV